MNNRTRRVGTLSAGVVLVGFGVVFLLRMALPTLSFGAVLSFWPIVLILLGFEMMYSYIFCKDTAVKYDGGAVAILLLLCVFAMCMAGGELVLEYVSRAAQYHFTW